MKHLDSSILVVDDDKDILTSLALYLKHHFKEVDTVNDPKDLIEILNTSRPDAVILDMNFRKGINDGREGMYWLNYIKELQPGIAVILLTAYGNLELAVEALKRGASDFLVKPWKNEKLLAALLRSIELQHSKKEIAHLKTVNRELRVQSGHPSPFRVLQSDVIRQVKNVVDKVAPTDANVLLTGPNGTGKEVVAHYIHSRYNTHEPFVKVDLGSLSDNLFEAELFGSEKGAYTGSDQSRMGKFELAGKGTLFLDEIGNVKEEQQMKLLNALQSRTVTPLGSNRSIPIEARFVFATNEDLDELVHQGRFRQDLLYRIRTLEVNLPPLKERREDIVDLAQGFLSECSAKYHKPGIQFSEACIVELLGYDWPGNIRELKHSIERATILAEKNILDPADLGLKKAETSEQQELFEDLNLEEVEKKCISIALQKYDGNVSRAAKALNINRNRLYRKMEKYGL